MTIYMIFPIFGRTFNQMPRQSGSSAGGGAAPCNWPSDGVEGVCYRIVVGWESSGSAAFILPPQLRKTFGISILDWHG